MITLKLGFVGVSLVTAFWATTSVAPQMDHVQQTAATNPADNGTSTGGLQAPYTSALPQFQDAMSNFAPHCRDATCDFGVLMSIAFSH